MLSFIPDGLKQALVDGLINFLAGQADNLADGTLGERLRGLASDGQLRRAMDDALRRAAARFQREYAAADAELVAAIAALPGFWEGAEVRRAVRELVARPGGWAEGERDALAAHLAAALPTQADPERVGRAVSALLGCAAEEVWAIPAAREIREVYALQLQRLGAEAVQRQAALAEQSLHASHAVSAGLRDAVLALLEQVRRQPALALPPPEAAPAGPPHNLPPPDPWPLAGRTAELARLRALLAPDDRAWQILILGVGGAGKTALARAVAHWYRERHAELPEHERFAAIIWVSAKEQVLTPDGAAPAAPDGLIFHTLDDIYAAVAQVLGRADLAQAAPAERDRLAQQALAAQRTLLVIDNFESVTDQRVRAFLRHLAPPTKALITSREWLDAAATVRLGGLDEATARDYLRQEAARRGLALSDEQAAALAAAAGGLPLPLRLALARLESGERPAAVLRWLGKAGDDLCFC